MVGTRMRGPGPRLVIMIPAAVVLVLGLNAGVLLLGLPAPISWSRLPDLHAPLLVFGFVGALIALERAVALRRRWPYGAPVLMIAGCLVALSDAPASIGPLLVVIGLGVHLAQYVAIWRRQPMTATAIQAAGAGVAVAAALTWAAGVAPALLVPMLASYLVLTIAGERLELARIANFGPGPERSLLVSAFALAVLSTLTLVVPAIAVPLSGLALAVIVLWLARYDVVRSTARLRGLPRYTAVCLIIGMGWLALASAGWMLGGAQSDGPIFDATTHAIMVGFVMTAIMAHAPLILPAVLRVSIPYHPALYVPVALLSVTLAVRVLFGDAAGLTWALRVGGIGSIAALVLFAVTVIVVATRRAAQASRQKGVHNVAS